MDQAILLERLTLDPLAPEAANTFAHWLFCFQAFIEASSGFAKTDKEKLQLLHSRVDQRIFGFLNTATTYDAALKLLKERYELKINTVYGRHMLASRRQLPGEPFDTFLDTLQSLSRACTLPAATSEERRQGLVLDALVSGIAAPHVSPPPLSTGRPDPHQSYNPR